MAQPEFSVEAPGVVVTQKQIRAKPTHQNTVLVDIDIVYPQVSVKENPQATKTIGGYYRTVAQEYYTYAGRKLFAKALEQYRQGQRGKTPFRPFSAAMSYAVPYNAGRLLSVTYDLYSFTGGAHGSTARYADTWDTAVGKVIPLGDFFKNASYRNVIFEEIFRQIEEQQAAGTQTFFEHFRSNVFRFYDDRNAYLTPEGIAVFFPPASIAPYASGFPVFVVPYAAFGGNLKPFPANVGKFPVSDGKFPVRDGEFTVGGGQPAAGDGKFGRSGPARG